LVLIKHLHNTGSKEASYFKAQDATICEGILVLVIPKYSLHAVLEYKGVNP
jgi:hypothetical protein